MEPEWQGRESLTPQARGVLLAHTLPGIAHNHSSDQAALPEAAACARARPYS